MLQLTFGTCLEKSHPAPVKGKKEKEKDGGKDGGKKGEKKVKPTVYRNKKK